MIGGGGSAIVYTQRNDIYLENTPLEPLMVFPISLHQK